MIQNIKQNIKNQCIKYITTLIFIVFYTLTAFSGEIVVEGIYQGKNLYIINPFSTSGSGFCIFEVMVNGKISNDEINSSAFEIDLAVYNLKPGDKIVIIIKHTDNCAPRVVNPEVLKPKSTFNASSIKIEKDGWLKWVTTDEAGSLPFVIEQFKWNKWVNIGTVQGKGLPGNNEYSFKVDFHSGENKFRVKQVDFTRKPRYSKEVRIRSTVPEVDFYPEKPTTQIEFSAETCYEIYNNNGELMLKGRAKTVNISGLPKGDYFLNYDSMTEGFRKK